MKKTLLALLLVSCFSYQLNAQDSNEKQQYDHWSIDLGAGVQQAGSTLSPGYNIDGLWQANFGVRYMFNERFGLRLDLGYNSFSDTGNSLPFKSNLYRASLEGVANLGNILEFQTWTNRFNLLAHIGGGASSLNITEPKDNGGDVMVTLNFGLTPQFKLSDRLSLFLDVSSFINFYQEDNFDGGPNTSTRESNISYFNTSIGLNIALGKNKQSADFWRTEKEELVINSELEDIKQRLDNAEKQITSLKVNNSDTDKATLITELDTRYAKKGEATKYENTVTSSNINFIKELLNKGYVNVYFGVNKTTIEKESLSAVNYLKQFMFDNPYVSASLIGFADDTGKEGYNQTLSKNRAKKVYDLLVDAGISPSRLSYGGVGEDKTLTNSARPLARKVAFRIN